VAYWAKIGLNERNYFMKETIKTFWETGNLTRKGKKIILGILIGIALVYLIDFILSLFMLRIAIY